MSANAGVSPRKAPVPVERIDLDGDVTAFFIPAGPDLDPVRAILVDHELGKGTLIVQCYNEAWTAYFGAMGERSLLAFIASVGRDYLGSALRVKNRDYGERIANALILEARAMRNVLNTGAVATDAANG